MSNSAISLSIIFCSKTAITDADEKGAAYEGGLPGGGGSPPSPAPGGGGGYVLGSNAGMRVEQWGNTCLIVRELLGGASVDECMAAFDELQAAALSWPRPSRP